MDCTRVEGWWWLWGGQWSMGLHSCFDVLCIEHSLFPHGPDVNVVYSAVPCFGLYSMVLVFLHLNNYIICAVVEARGSVVG
jgi:hypothetical protein